MRAISRRQALLMGSGTMSVMLSGCLGDSDTDDDDDTVGGEGEPVEMTFRTAAFQNYEDEARFIADQWEENLGVDVNFEVSEWTTHLGEVFGQGDFEHAAMAVHAPQLDRMDPAYHMGNYLDEQIPVPNLTRWSNDEYDQLYADFLAEIDEDERLEILAELQEILHEESPALNLGYSPSITPYRSDIWEFDVMSPLGVNAYTTITLIGATPLTDEDTLQMGQMTSFETGGNPLNIVGGTFGMIWHIVYDTPRRHDVNGNVIDWACDTQLIDNETVRLSLIDDLEFHNGDPVTIEDVQFSLNYYQEHDFQFENPHADPIDDVDITGDNELTIHLRAPNAPWYESALTILRILPESIWGEIDEPETYSMPDEEMVGSGPFELTSMEAHEVTFTAIDEHPIMTAEYDQLVYSELGGPEALRAELEAGNIHLSTTGIRELIAQEIAASHDDITIVREEGLGLDHYSFNTTNFPMSERNFRQALVRSIDVTQFDAIYHDGHFSFTDNTPVHPNLIDSRADTTNLVDWFDPDAARDLLSEIGFDWDDDDNLIYVE